MTVTSFAFKLRKNEKGLSVNIEKLTTLQESILDISRFRLFSITAKNVRAAGADCFHEPVDGNYAHAAIVHANLNKISSQLARNAVYVPFP